MDLNFINENPFYEFASIFLLAAVFALIGRFLKQPLIVSFLAAGIFIGPSFLDLLQSMDKIHLLAELGIALLLFVVGLKLDISELKSLGKISLLTGLGQVLFTSVFGYLIGMALGYTPLAALYIAVALTFSSTIIIVKLLSDKKEVDALHGKIAIGFLIVQDIVVILMMIFLSALEVQVDGDHSYYLQLALFLLKGFGFLFAVFILATKILPYLMDKLAKSMELLVLFAIAWAIILAAIGDYLGFGKEVGAFIAGVALASNAYRESISNRLVSLRDFLLLFFFIQLGAGLDLALVGEKVSHSVIFSLFVVIGNPLIVLIIMGFMGYSKRTGFLAGLTVAQISEFSLIFAAMGVSLGHLDQASMGLITLVGITTIALSTYMILYSHPLYKLLAPALSIFEREKVRDIQDVPDKKFRGIDIVVFGLGRFGTELIKELEANHKKVLAIDFDPNLVKARLKANKPAMYGDILDPELAEKLPLDNLNMVVSSSRDLENNLALIHFLQENSYKGKIVVSSELERHTKRLNEAGATLVLQPFRDSASLLCKLV